MFTPEGDLRPGYEAEEREEAAKPATPSPPPPPEASATTAKRAGPAPPSPAPPDPSGSRRRDPAVARQMIDWLGVLEQKTRGNLTFEESDLLARILYELRMAYVEVMRPPTGEPKR